MNIKIIYEDKNYILCEKPPAMPCQADKTGDKSLQEYLADNRKSDALSIINRLDRPVGGIVLFAKNKISAAYASSLMQNGGAEKYYYAVICGVPAEKNGILQDYIVKNSKTNTSFISVQTDKNAKKAVLKYEIIKTINDDEYGFISLVKIKLETGRHHQIRVQFSSRGLPLWGDTKYNTAFSKRRGFFTTALWSAEIKFYDKLSKGEIIGKSTPSGDIWECFK